MEENNVTIDTTNDTAEETVTPDLELDLDLNDESTDNSNVDVEALQATNKKLYERAKKAEEALKATKAQGTPKQVSPQLNVEEVVLLANGMPEELIKELKAVAQVRGTSLIKAQSDPIFVAVKEKFEKDQKQQSASLPASRGSGNIKPKKDFSTPDLSREEHKRMAMEATR